MAEVDKMSKRKSAGPHTLDSGWVNGIRKLGDGVVSTKWGRYAEIEVELAKAADMSPRLLRQYAVEMIQRLGMREEVLKRLTE